MWTRIGAPTGIVILSAYLWHSEVLSLRNRELILAAIANAKYFGCPWVLGADFQISPDDLQAQFGTVLEHAGAYIVATSQPTFRPGGKTQSTIDYFIVCRALKDHIADAVVDLACGISPIGRRVALYEL